MEILRNTQGRVFVSTGNTNPFKYYGSMSVGAIEKTLPTTESVFTIDSNGNVVKIAEIKDHDKQPSAASLTGYIPLLSKSNIESLLDKSNVDIQVHYGTCENPSAFNSFDSALILRGVTLTNYNISEPSTLIPNRATLQETANIVIDNSYRIFTPTFQQVLGEVGMISMLGVVFADSNYCDIGDNNLNILIARYDDGIFGRFAYSFNNGSTWKVNPELFAVSSGGALNTGITVFKNKVFWSYIFGSDAYVQSIDVSDIINDTSVSSTLIFKHPSYSIIKDMVATSNYLWCAGGWGASFVMRVDLSTNITEIIDDDSIFSSTSVNAIDALDDNLVVLVGENNNIATYSNGVFYESSIGLDSMAFLSDIKILTDNHWVVASDMGLYITTNGGISWRKTFSVQNTCKFAFYDNLTGYAANTDGVYRTVDGGNSWYKIFTALWANINGAVIDKHNPNNIFFAETFYVYSSL
jgi:hypothetical protein